MKVIISFILLFTGFWQDAGFTPKPEWFGQQPTTFRNWTTEVAQSYNPKREDANQYLLIYSASVSDYNNNYLVPAYGVTMFSQTSSGMTTSGNLIVNTHIVRKMDTFASLEEVTVFLSLHTTTKYPNSMLFSLPDSPITDIEGLYKLTPAGIEKVKTGTHKEYVQKTEEKEVPTYEWRVQ